jgi:hypothetical protein
MKVTHPCRKDTLIRRSRRGLTTAAKIATEPFMWNPSSASLTPILVPTVILPLKTCARGICISMSYPRGDTVACLVWWPLYPGRFHLNESRAVLDPSRSTSTADA